MSTFPVKCNTLSITCLIFATRQWWHLLVILTWMQFMGKKYNNKHIRVYHECTVSPHAHTHIHTPACSHLSSLTNVHTRDTHLLRYLAC